MEIFQPYFVDALANKAEFHGIWAKLLGPGGGAAHAAAEEPQVAQAAVKTTEAMATEMAAHPGPISAIRNALSALAHIH